MRRKNLRFLPRTYLPSPPRSVPNVRITDSHGRANHGLTAISDV